MTDLQFEKILQDLQSIFGKYTSFNVLVQDFAGLYSISGPFYEELERRLAAEPNFKIGVTVVPAGTAGAAVVGKLNNDDELAFSIISWDGRVSHRRNIERATFEAWRDERS